MRNRYLDLLRAAAIVRVIIYHLFGWPWLSIAMPAMGIMFALAGSLAASSLDDRAARRVIASRLRRLLPPLWLLGLLAVPVMLALGWAHEVAGDHPFSVPRLAFWLLPLGDPPGSDKGVDVWEPLWYIRAYVWFVLLSPLLYLAYRRVGWLAVAAPLLLIAVLDATGFSLPDTADAAMWDFATYGACWIAGFAHHDGRLARLRGWIVIAAAAVLGAAALVWLRGHQGEDAWDLNDVSESQALWSLAFVLLALRWQPSMRWLTRARPLDRAVTLLNARAVTIYLWHNLAITLIWPVLTVLTLDDLGRLDGPAELATALLLTGVAVLAFGWAEDLAAKRRPRLWPTGGPALRPEPVAARRYSMPALVGAPGPAAGPAGSGTPPAGDGIPGSGAPVPGASPPGSGTGQAAIFGTRAPDGPGASAAPGGRTAAALGGRTGAAAALGGRTGAAAALRGRTGAVAALRGGTGAAAALRGGTGAVAALTRQPAVQPPAPRSGDDEAAVARRAAGRHQPGDVGSGTRDLGLPVAGRRAEPIDGTGPATGGTDEAGTATPASESGPVRESGPARDSKPLDNSGPASESVPANGPGPANPPVTPGGDAEDGDAEDGDAGVGDAGVGDAEAWDAEVWEGEIWDGEGTGTWAATGPVLGTPSEFGWTAAPGEPTRVGEQPGRPGGDRPEASSRVGPWHDGMPDWFRHRRDRHEPEE